MNELVMVLGSASSLLCQRCPISKFQVLQNNITWETSLVFVIMWNNYYFFLPTVFMKTIDSFTPVAHENITMFINCHHLTYLKHCLLTSLGCGYVLYKINCRGLPYILVYFYLFCGSHTMFMLEI